MGKSGCLFLEVEAAGPFFLKYLPFLPPLPLYLATGLAGGAAAEEVQAVGGTTGEAGCTTKVANPETEEDSACFLRKLLANKEVNDRLPEVTASPANS